MSKINLESLNGKFARISLGGVRIEGSIESPCKLEVQGSSIMLGSKLEWNRIKVSQGVMSVINKTRSDIGMTYEMRNSIVDELIPHLDGVYIHVGRIYLLEVKTVMYEYCKGELYSVNITYENGTSCLIHAISDK
jgi:hypothetical protein